MNPEQFAQFQQQMQTFVQQQIAQAFAAQQAQAAPIAPTAAAPAPTSVGDLLAWGNNFNTLNTALTNNTSLITRLVADSSEGKTALAKLLEERKAEKEKLDDFKARFERLEGDKWKFWVYAGGAVVAYIVGGALLRSMLGSDEAPMSGRMNPAWSNGATQSFGSSMAPAAH